MSIIYSIKHETLAQIANAIRTKNGTEREYTPNEMAQEISQIQSGGANMNVVYGDSVPENTDALWVKTTTPAAVRIQPTIQAGNEKIEMAINALPAAATGVAAAAVGKKVYSFGGINDGVRLDAIHVLDTETNTITTLTAKLPVAASHIAAVAVGKNIYLFGGSAGNNLDTIHVFDAENLTISTLSTTLPYAARMIAAAAVGTKVYLFGGMSNTNLSTINVFDTENNTILTLSETLPEAAHGIAAAAVGRTIYLFGGTGNNDLSTICAFNTETNTLAVMSATISAAAGAFYSVAAAIGKKIYLFGGKNLAYSRTNTIVAYDTTNDAISILAVSLPVVAENMGAAAVGVNVYLFGGRGTTYLNAIHKFSAGLALPNNHVLIEMSLTDNLLELIADQEVSVQIGVANVYIGNADGVAEKATAATYQGGTWVEI